MIWLECRHNMSQQFPIREQRKAETRQKLIHAAQELFMQKGYEATTLDGVAAHAGLHVQTLYRHFSSKIELAAAGDEEQLNHFRTAIREKPNDVPTIQFWRIYVSEATRQVTSQDDGRGYREVLHEELQSPVIAKQLMQLGLVYKDLIAESLELELNIDDPKERREAARLIAITLFGTHEDLLFRYERGGEFDLLIELVAAIDRVENFCQPLFK